MIKKLTSKQNNKLDDNIKESYTDTIFYDIIDEDNKPKSNEDKISITFDEITLPFDNDLNEEKTININKSIDTIKYTTILDKLDIYKPRDEYIPYSLDQDPQTKIIPKLPLPKLPLPKLPLPKLPLPNNNYKKKKNYITRLIGGNKFKLYDIYLENIIKEIEQSTNYKINRFTINTSDTIQTNVQNNTNINVNILANINITQIKKISPINLKIILNNGMFTFKNYNDIIFINDKDDLFNNIKMTDLLNINTYTINLSIGLKYILSNFINNKYKLTLKNYYILYNSTIYEKLLVITPFEYMQILNNKTYDNLIIFDNMGTCVYNIKNIDISNI